MSSPPAAARGAQIRRPTGVRALVLALTTATFVQWIGAGAVLPVLPLYLRRQGASDALVGTVMAAFFAAGVICQYPAGRLADRIGRRPVLLAGLLCYAAASAGFLARVGPGAEVALRFLQGAGAGAAELAALATLGASVPADQRGRAFGALYGGQLAGLAIGPFAGSLAGIAHMPELFLGAGVAAALACVPVLLTARPATPVELAGERGVGPPPGPVPPPGALGPPSPPDAAGRPGPLLRANPALLGVLLTGLAAGLLGGAYEACWSLLLHLRGATSWQIGLSWTLFAIPFVLVSVPAGRLADRFDRRWLVVAALTSSVGFAASYPFLSSVGWLLGLGCIESVGVAVAYPAAQSLLTQAVPAARLGAAQGMYSTAQTGALALAAALGGVLFGAGPWLPFVGAAVAAGLLTAALPAVWRTVPGRVSPAKKS